MPLSYCKSCRKRFTGLECPDCGRPLPITGCVLAFIPTIAIVGLFSLVLPAETAPRISEGSDGDIHYVFISLRRAVLLPAGIVLFILFACLVTLRMRVPPRPSADSLEPGLAGAASHLSGNVGKAIRCAILGILIVFLCLVTLGSMNTIRSLTVTDSEVLLHALFRNTRLAHEDIVDTEFKRTDGYRRGSATTDLLLTIRTRARTHTVFSESIEQSNPDLAELEKTLEAAINDLNERIESDPPAEKPAEGETRRP